MKAPSVEAPSPSFRDRRRESALGLFESGALFAAGLACMPAFLFNPSIAMRIAQFFLFWFFAWALGKRISLPTLLLAMAGIIGFNLLVGYGLEIARIGPLRITEGALKTGVSRAVTVEGLILLSRAGVRSDLRLPGAFGSLLGESFRYFDRIIERKGGIERKDPIGGIDRLMIDLWNERDSSISRDAKRNAAPRRPAVGYLALAVAAAAAWLPFLAARFAGAAIPF